MKASKKRSLFLIAAASIIVLTATIISNLNPINAIYADNVSYGMTFNSSKNKFHNYSGATPYSGESTVKTNLDNNVNFEYKDLMGLNNTWHVVKAGGYFTNLDPINGLEKIDISFKSDNVDYKIYWSYTTTFDEINIYTGTSSTTSPLNFNFNRSYPTYFKFENVGGKNLNVNDLKISFTCLKGNPTVVVNSNDETLGTVSGGGTFVYGDRDTLIAKPSLYCEFLGWYENEVLISLEMTYQYIVEYDRDIVGRFAKKVYFVDVSINDASMGYTTGQGGYTYGEQVTLLAIPNEQHIFLGWFKDNELVSEDFKIMFTMEDENVLYHAKFAQVATITLINQYNELGYVTGGGTFIVGTSIVVKATPFDHCEFLGWYEGDVLISNELEYELIVSCNTDITAKFAKTLHVVSVSSNGDEMGKIEGAGKYAYQDEVTLTAKPHSGYSFFGWYKDNQLIQTEETLTFTMGDYDVHYAARFVKNYKLYIYSDDEKRGIVSGPQECGGGLEVTVKALPNENFFFGYWYDENLNEVSFDKDYTFVMPNHDVYLYAYFEVGYRIKIINYNDNYISAFGEGLYRKGENVVLTVEYQVGEFIGWYENDKLLSNEETFAFSCDTSHDIEVRWHNLTLSGFSITSCPKDIKAVYMPDDATGIWNGAFSQCKMEYVTFGENIVYVGKYSFDSCRDLKEMKINSKVECFVEDAMTGGTRLNFQKVYYEGTIEEWCSIDFQGSFANPLGQGDSVKFYIKKANNVWDEITELTIPNTITKIGNYQFDGFRNLRSVTLHDEISHIGKYSFRDTSFSIIDLPKGLISIGNYAFSGNENVEFVIIPSSVTEVGELIFKNNLSVTFFVGVSSKPDGWHNSWKYEYNLVVWGITSENLAYANGLYFAINDGYAAVIASDKDNKFFDIPSSISVNGQEVIVNEINSNVFYNRSKPLVYIPNSIEYIHNPEFGYHSIILFEDNSKKDGWDSDWLDDPELVLYWGVKKEEIVFYEESYYLLKEESATLISYLGNAEEVIVPNHIQHSGKTYSVNVIGDAAFSSLTKLKNVKLNDGIVEIGKYSFYWCTDLEFIAIPNTLEKIGYRAFSYCNSLSAIYIPSSAIHIDDSAFDYCQHYILISNEEVFRDKDFIYAIHQDQAILIKYTGNVPNVLIPDTVNLNEKNFTIYQIYAYAFADHEEIETISIPSSITFINSAAFWGCSSLETIVISKNVETVGESIFYGCDNLKTVYVEHENKPEGWSNKWMAGSTADIYWGNTWKYNEEGIPTLLSENVQPDSCLDPLEVILEIASKIYKVELIEGQHYDFITSDGKEIPYTFITLSDQTSYSEKVEELIPEGFSLENTYNYGDEIILFYGDISRYTVVIEVQIIFASNGETNILFGSYV